MFLLDAVREMYRYGSVDDMADQGARIRDHDKEVELHLRLFRAQRNFYIAGFSLYLFFVLKRLITTIHFQAGLIAEKEAALKQAASASAVASNLMGDSGKGASNEIVEKLKEELDESKKAQKSAEADLNSMKTQSENTAKEYDRLLAEYEKMEKKLKILGGDGGSGDKKDD